MPDKPTTLRLLQQSADDLAREVAQTPPEARMWRAKEGEWSVQECLAHLRDVERLVFLERVRRILAEERPLLPNFDETTYHREHWNPDEPADAILADYASARKEMVELASAAPDWTRGGVHEMRGPITLAWQIDYALGHTWEHLSQILRVRLARELSRPAA